MRLLRPDWPAPPAVRAVSTTREGGLSSGPYASLNLGDHVGDDPLAVQRNRARLRARAGVPVEPHWLRQVHGCTVSVLPSVPTSVPSSVPPSVPPSVALNAATSAADACVADASVAFGPGSVCVVMTADCLPILLCDAAGGVVAAVHAGWRGLAAGVIEATVRRMRRPAGQLLAWLGPAIGPEHFEVGDEVRATFCAARAEAAMAFRRGVEGRWLADLGLLARQRLGALGVRWIGGGEHCTFAEPERFFSYRRDGVSGRMASLIWLESPALCDAT